MGMGQGTCLKVHNASCHLRLLFLAAEVPWIGLSSSNDLGAKFDAYSIDDLCRTVSVCVREREAWLLGRAMFDVPSLHI